MRNDEADVRGTLELMKTVDDYTIGVKYILPNMTDPENGQGIRRELMDKFKGQDVEVLEPIPYDKDLSMVHSPSIDDLYMHKYPDGEFSKSITKLKDIILSRSTKDQRK
jgi:hypothetical protein